MDYSGSLEREGFLWLLGSLRGLHRIPFAAALIAQDFPPPTILATLHEADRALGFKTGTRAVAGIGRSKLPYPAIAFLKTPDPLSTVPGVPSPRRTPGSSTAADPESDACRKEETEFPPIAPIFPLDGKDIRTLAANELRSVFGVVPQETVLFSGTLYDNLVMAHLHASFEDVITACKAAEIHEVIGGIHYPSDSEGASGG